jgi:hypothetical protein
MGLVRLDNVDLGEVKIAEDESPDSEADTFAHEPGEPGGLGGFGGPPVDSGMYALTDPFAVKNLQLSATSISLNLESNVSDYVDSWTCTEVASGVFADTEDSLAIKVIAGPQADDAIREAITLRIASTTFGIGRLLELHETAIDSNVFESEHVEIVMAMSDELSMFAVDQVDLTVASSMSTQTHSGLLTETVMDSNVFENADQSLRLELLETHQQDAATKEDGVALRAHVLARVTSSVLDLQDVEVDAIETSVGSLLFRTDALHNQGGGRNDVREPCSRLTFRSAR